ncbi:YHS domain-containing protein [bacterium]|nr:YHS domain-containing protein [bacterium]
MEVGGDPLTTLVQHFDNATLHRSRDRRGHTATCRFRHTPRFPASVTLTFEWGHDEEVRRVIVGSHLRILPVFIDFEHEDQIVYELDAVDESAIRRWVEDKIVSFVKVYLRIEVTDAYQRYNRVTDPVSGTRFPQTLAKAESEYQGHRYSFLSDETKLEFDADPERFVSTGRETGPRRVPVPSGRRAGRPATSRAGLG